MVGNGKCLTVTHVGIASLHCSNATLKLLNVLGMPPITKSLISISKLTSKNDVYIEFYSKFCLVKDKHTGKVMLQGRLKNGLYLLNKAKTTTGSDDTRSCNFLRHVSSDNKSSILRDLNKCSHLYDSSSWSKESADVIGKKCTSIDDLAFTCTDNEDLYCIDNDSSILEHEYDHCAATALNVFGHVDLGDKSDSHVYVSSQSTTHNV